MLGPEMRERLGRSLHQQQVAGRDRGHQHPADARPLEHGLDLDRAAEHKALSEQLSELQAAHDLAADLDAVLAEVDFASLGTNDLTQYAMAADRMSTELAALTDPWQPAVLRLIQLTARAGIDADKPVGVCGEAAGDPGLAVVLVGLGVNSLSMTPRSLPAVAKVLSTVTLEQAKDLAAKALAARTSEKANRTLYLLTLAAAIFLPVNLIAALLGANVGGIPGAESPLGFLVLSLLTVGIIAIEVALFMRLRLL